MILKVDDEKSSENKNELDEVSETKILKAYIQ